MPTSYSFFKNEVKEHFLKNINVNTKILDVGPGCGTYGLLLKPEFIDIDSVEIWENYIDQYNLKHIYKNIYTENILTFDFSNYDYLILGDILEHISLIDAQDLVKRICEKNKKCLIAVPYMYPQGAYEGNIYETHLQPDITPENFLERYPELECLFKNEFYGYYINYQ